MDAILTYDKHIMDSTFTFTPIFFYVGNHLVGRAFFLGPILVWVGLKTLKEKLVASLLGIQQSDHSAQSDLPLTV